MGLYVFDAFLRKSFFKFADGAGGRLVGGVGAMRPIGLIRPIGVMGLIGPIGRLLRFKTGCRLDGGDGEAVECYFFISLIFLII